MLNYLEGCSRVSQRAQRLQERWHRPYQLKLSSERNSEVKTAVVASDICISTDQWHACFESVFYFIFSLYLVRDCCILCHGSDAQLALRNAIVLACGVLSRCS